MSRKGGCSDNAPMESCGGLLKTELIHRWRFATRKEARCQVTGDIKLFYNRMRKQARLGFLSPAMFRQEYLAKQLAA